MIKQISENDFEKFVFNNDKLVLLEFFGEWCMPCKLLSSILEDIDKKIGNKIDILKFDVDENLSIPKKFGVLTVPTIIIIVNGEIVEKMVGFRQENQILDLVTSYLD